MPAWGAIAAAIASSPQAQDIARKGAAAISQRFFASDDPGAKQPRSTNDHLMHELAQRPTRDEFDAAFSRLQGDVGQQLLDVIQHQRRQARLLIVGLVVSQIVIAGLLFLALR